MLKLLKTIHSSINDAEIEKLPSTLESGRLGIALLAKRDTRSRTVMCECLKRTIAKKYSLPNGFLYGNLGLIWTLTKFAEDDFFDDKENLQVIAKQFITENTRYYFDSPVRYNIDEPIYSIGLVMLSLMTNDDSLDRYSQQQKLIMRLVECEAILTKRVRYLHDPKNLGYGMLHSIYQFASDAERQRIYTFKAHQLQQLIEKWPHKVTDKSLAHRYIFEYLTGNPVCRDFLSARPGRRVDMLAEVGLFAFIYRRPQMFEDLYDALTASDAIFYSRLSDTVATGHACPKTLIGIGLGITSCIENEKS